MKTVGSFDAKTRLSELLERVSHGESFLITKHGRPMARLVPDSGPSDQQIGEALEQLKKYRGMVKVSLQELLDDRHAGHRY